MFLSLHSLWCAQKSIRPWSKPKHRWATDELEDKLHIYTYPVIVAWTLVNCFASRQIKGPTECNLGLISVWPTVGDSSFSFSHSEILIWCCLFLTVGPRSPSADDGPGKDFKFVMLEKENAPIKKESERLVATKVTAKQFMSAPTSDSTFGKH